jgi:hypothetical protein
MSIEAYHLAFNLNGRFLWQNDDMVCLRNTVFSAVFDVEVDECKLFVMTALLQIGSLMTFGSSSRRQGRE